MPVFLSSLKNSAETMQSGGEGKNKDKEMQCFRIRGPHSGGYEEIYFLGCIDV
jgi:hypothetical protein